MLCSLLLCDKSPQPSRTQEKRNCYAYRLCGSDGWKRHSKPCCCPAPANCWLEEPAGGPSLLHSLWAGLGWPWEGCLWGASREVWVVLGYQTEHPGSTASENEFSKETRRKLLAFSDLAVEVTPVTSALTDWLQANSKAVPESRGASRPLTARGVGGNSWPFIKLPQRINITFFFFK